MFRLEEILDVSNPTLSTRMLSDQRWSRGKSAGVDSCRSLLFMLEQEPESMY